MKIKLVFGAVLSATVCLTCVAQAPQAEIRNDKITAKIYLPDAKQGFYRGTRFDWSGVIFDLEFAGHHLYRPWFVSTDPAVRDFSYEGDGIVAAPNSAMTGPAEEFQKPIGYETAKAGETFLKVGVGLLRKVDDTPYQFGKHFDLVDGGTWTTQKTANSVSFQQVLGDGTSDYGYVYTKTIRLVGNEGEMVMEHHLKNTGKVRIETPLYDHNFLTIDSENIGSAYSIVVPYEIKSTRAPDAKFVQVQGGKAEYVADLQGKDRAAFGLQGFTDSPKQYDFTIANQHAGVQVHMAGDRPLVNASVWSIRNVLAVEPFINIAVDPAKEFSWTYKYTYTAVSSKH